jgi:predicted N-acetyltransferase YhbS
VQQISLRRATPADAALCGRICHDAFRSISERHNFPPDFPGPEAAVGLVSWLIRHPGFFDVVAESGGRVVGSNFLDERDPIAGIGPITVDPEVQDARVGRRLMEAVLDRAEERRVESVRLCQAAYHGRSLALYSKLGFDVREPLSCVQGSPPQADAPGRQVRRAGPEDVERCGELCERVHGQRRNGELTDAVAAGTATLVERQGRITGYASQIAFFGHAVAETNEDLAALITAAAEFGGPGFLVPTRNAELMRWCLSHGLRIVQPMTLMSRGAYAEPRGAWLPSVLY